MQPYQLIRRKRDGEALDPRELRELLRAFQHGRVPDYQMAAFLMAVYFRGLSEAELRTAVDVMIESGETVDFAGAPGRRVDKHSTGGVGDKVSLIVAPLAAALGVQVPMMSGRGLGHTGGTTDKLESIPGFTTDLPLAAFRAQVLRLGLALIGQTEEITPLDRRLYALRDVTAAVESIPLIASSIMSKKIAEGIDGLVLDVKVGNGAFMTEEPRALELARALIAIGRDHGCETVALLTAMDRPLGRAIGNALEVREAIDVLHGGGPADVRAVTLELAAEMLVLGGVASSRGEACSAAERALDDGRALEVMRRVIEAQHGDPGVLDDPARLPAAPVVRTVDARDAGVLAAFDTRALGEAATALGAGRARLDQRIDPRVGLVLRARLGEAVEEGTPLVEVHAADEAAADRAAAAVLAAVRVGERAERARALVSHRVTVDGTEVLTA